MAPERRVAEIFGPYDSPPPPDPILGLMSEFKADQREGKISLAIGYLIGPDGKVYVPPSVRRASEIAPKIHSGYLIPDAKTGWNGNRVFMEGVARVVLGERAQDLLDQNLIAAASTVGGTQAVSLFAEAVRRTEEEQGRMPRVAIGEPPYPNHPNIFKGAGFEIDYYNHLTPEGRFNLIRTVAAIETADPRSIVLFQGAAHNPTGINAKSEDEWNSLADAMKGSGATAFFDLPYAGLDRGISEDTVPARIFMEKGIPTAVAFSFSKISGLYAERVGVLLTVCPDEVYSLNTTNLFNGIIREINSSPGAWGQAVMAEVFKDQDLYAQWTKDDLPAIAKDIKRRRLILADALPEEVGRVVESGAGIFTTLPISSEGAKYLKEKHAVYVVPNKDGSRVRINIGGVTDEQMHVAALAIAETYGLYHA